MEKIDTETTGDECEAALLNYVHRTSAVVHGDPQVQGISGTDKEAIDHPLLSPGVEVFVVTGIGQSLHVCVRFL